MINEQLKEIEQWIGRHQPTEFLLKKGEGIVYETINPNGHIQRLANEVRRLWTERDSDRRHTNLLAKRIRELNVEIDGGTGADGVPEHGWKALVVELKKRVGELEKEISTTKAQRAQSREKEGVKYSLSRNQQAEKLKQLEDRIRCLELQAAMGF